jgi:hypothetical protein
MNLCIHLKMDILNYSELFRIKRNNTKTTERCTEPADINYIMNYEL